MTRQQPLLAKWFKQSFHFDLVMRVKKYRAEIAGMLRVILSHIIRMFSYLHHLAHILQAKLKLADRKCVGTWKLWSLVWNAE